MSQTAGSAPTIHHADLAREIQSPAPPILLDVRSPGEFESSHIPGSVNIPLDELGSVATRLSEHLVGPLALVCQSGARARSAANMLRQNGVAQARVLDGGIAAWEQSGGDVVRGRAHWAMERQVRLVAGSLVLSGIVGSLLVPRLKWLAGAIGAGLTFSALSNTCAMANVLGRLPYNRGTSYDLESSIDAIAIQARRISEAARAAG